LRGKDLREPRFCILQIARRVNDNERSDRNCLAVALGPDEAQNQPSYKQDKNRRRDEN
jgi:hypothetical protein